MRSEAREQVMGRFRRVLHTSVLGLFLCSCFGLSTLSASPARAAFDVESLAGVPAFKVMVKGADEDLIRRLQTRTVRRLRKAEVGVGEHPVFLYVTLDSLHKIRVDEPAPFSWTLIVAQEVTLVRNGSTGLTQTYIRSTIGHGGRQEVADALELLLDTFLADYRKANPEPGSGS